MPIPPFALHKRREESRMKFQTHLQSAILKNLKIVLCNQKNLFREPG